MIFAENLTKYYDHFCAVDRISFEVRKGEIMGLLGPNGAGKTTTLKMLTGYFPPSDGTIRVKDYTMEENALDIKQMIGYLPESSPFYKPMLVYDYLMHVAGIRGVPPQDRIPRLKYLSDLCGLKGIMHKTIGELSKGLNQRVGLAHAMMNDPEILILDEPTQGLDPNQIVEIRSIIRRIGREKTVIFSTHILSEAEATCDRIMIINRGRIVADGDTRDLKLSGQGTLIHLTLKNAEFADVKKNMGSIEGVEKVEKTGPSDNGLVSVTVTCRSEDDLRETIYRKIKATDWTLMDFHQEAHTLESIFRNLTCQ